jgi:hypothetical protein
MTRLPHRIRCAIGRMIIWLTAPVTAPAWQPWVPSEEAQAELVRRRVADMRAWAEATKDTLTPRPSPDITPGLLSADLTRRLLDNPTDLPPASCPPPTGGAI